MSSVLQVDPRHGTHQPTTTTPARRPRSVRRTTTVEACYPDGPGGRLVLRGQGRDLITHSTGRPAVGAEAGVDVGVHFERGPVVTSVDTVPRIDASLLVGRVASSGFRAAIDADTQAIRGTLLYLLLDEIPAATLVGGYSVMHAVRRGDIQPSDTSGRRPRGPALQVADLCAGWQTGGVIMTEVEQHGNVPQVTGPPAPDVGDPGDPWAWHQAPPMSPDGMRRRRRIDVTAAASSTVEIDVFFRDSHMGPDGNETVLHEYTVQATADPAAGRILECTATPRVLPWRECPQAADSAGRLAQISFEGLRHRVRTEFVGPPTCTHLNDTLRGLEDVPHLIGLLPPT